MGAYDLVAMSWFSPARAPDSARIFIPSIMFYDLEIRKARFKIFWALYYTKLSQYNGLTVNPGSNCRDEHIT